jgi:hypothetical protein
MPPLKGADDITMKLPGLNTPEHFAEVPVDELRFRKIWVVAGV